MVPTDNLTVKNRRVSQTYWLREDSERSLVSYEGCLKLTLGGKIYQDNCKILSL